MKEHICILRNSNLIDLVSINVMDGHSVAGAQADVFEKSAITNQIK